MLGDRPFLMWLADVVVVSHSYGQLYSVINWPYSAKEVDLEYQNRYGKGQQYTFGWNDDELFILSPAVSAEYYARITSNREE